MSTCRALAATLALAVVAVLAPAASQAAPPSIPVPTDPQLHWQWGG